MKTAMKLPFTSVWMIVLLFGGQTCFLNAWLWGKDSTHSRAGAARAQASAYGQSETVESLCRVGEYAQALIVLDDLPENAPPLTAQDQRRRDRLAAIAAILPVARGKDRAFYMIRRGIGDYLYGDPARGLSALRYAADLSPERPDIPRIISLVVGEYPALAASGPPPGMTFVDWKLGSALDHIYQKQFPEAIKECLEVLDVAPENVLALTRAGSAYYAMEDDNHAVQYWRKAALLDPANPALKGFIASRSAASGTGHGDHP